MDKEFYVELCDVLTRQIDLNNRKVILPKELASKNPLSHLTPMQSVMLKSIASSGEINMTQLARYVGVSNQRLTRPIDKLVQLGLVDRHFIEGNRKAIYLKLTDKCRELLQEERAMYVNYISTKLGITTSDQEKIKFKVACEYIVNILERF